MATGAEEAVAEVWAELAGRSQHDAEEALGDTLFVPE